MVTRVPGYQDSVLAASVAGVTERRSWLSWRGEMLPLRSCSYLLRPERCDAAPAESLLVCG